jgi:hypothetical protein
MIVDIVLGLPGHSKYVSPQAVLFFVLLPLILTGMAVDFVYAVGGIVASDNRNSYRLRHNHEEDPEDYEIRSGDWRPSILLTQSEYPIKDENPIGEDETPGKVQAPAEPITRALPVMAEGGVGNRRHVILGAFFRF